MGLEPASMCPSIYTISETSGPIVFKFHLRHHWAGGKAALGADPFRSLVSMATDSSHSVIMEKTASPSFSAVF